MENRVVDEATNRLVLFHSLEEMFSPIFQLLSTLRPRSQRLRQRWIEVWHQGT
jgi:hypothetical protein